MEKAETAEFFDELEKVSRALGEWDQATSPFRMFMSPHAYRAWQEERVWWLTAPLWLKCLRRVQIRAERLRDRLGWWWECRLPVLLGYDRYD